MKLFSLYSRCLPVFLGIALTCTTGTAGNNALLNGASNETIVFVEGDFGNDTVMNFTTAVDTAAKPLAKSPKKVKQKIVELNNELSGLANEGIKQVSISTTMNTSGMPVFGLTGSNVPVTIILLFSTGPGNGPIESFSQGTNLVGKTLQDDFIGYRESHILTIYIKVGESAGTGTELIWLNPDSSGKTSSTPNTPGTVIPVSLFLPDTTYAQAWFNRSLANGVPNRMAFGVNGAGGSYFDMGDFFAGGTTFDFTDDLVIFDGNNAGLWTVTPAQKAEKKVVKLAKSFDLIVLSQSGR